MIIYQQALRLSVVTPLFSGDDPTSAVDTSVRVPSIRGALRFWFRAVAAGHGVTDLKALWAQETEILGSTSVPSPIALRVRQQPLVAGKGKPAWAMYPPRRGPGPEPFRGAQYLLGQGLWNYQNGLTRPYVAPGALVELDIRFGPDETVNARFMLALWAWLTYGGLGARTRRGFGQLRCDEVAGDLPGGWTPDQLRPPTHRDGWRSLGGSAVPEDIRHTLNAAWPRLATEQPADDEPLPEFPALCPRWWAGETLGGIRASLAEALHVAGAEWRLFRAADPRKPEKPDSNTHSPEWLNVIHGHDQRYPVAALGLPVGYFSKATKDRPTIKLTIEPRSAVPLRRASPVWIRPVQLDRGWTVFTHAFWAQLLPHDAHLVVSGYSGPRTLPVPDDQVLKAAWDAWLDDEDRLHADYYRNGT